MAEEKDTLGLGGFQQISSFLTGKPAGDDNTLANVDEPRIVDPEIVKAPMGDGEVINKESNLGGDDDLDDQGNPIVPDTTTPQTPEITDPEGDVLENDLAEFEPDITSFMNEKFAEKLGWDLGDEDAPKTFDEFIDFMGGIVAENSKPEFANSEMEKLNSFVKDGGSLKDFYSNTISNKVNVNTVEIDKASNQRQVIKENFKNLGYKEDRIDKMITRYEENGTLEDEANDALDLLKEYNTRNEQKLLEDQRNYAEAQKEQQLTFVNSVQDNIKKLDETLGMTISAKDKKDMQDYILVADENGQTAFQKEMLGNIEKFVASAYYTKNGTTMQSRIKKQGGTDAVKNLHTKMKTIQGNPGRTSAGQSSGDVSDGLSLLGSMLRG